GPQRLLLLLVLLDDLARLLVGVVPELVLLRLGQSLTASHIMLGLALQLLALFVDRLGEGLEPILVDRLPFAHDGAPAEDDLLRRRLAEQALQPLANRRRFPVQLLLLLRQALLDRLAEGLSPGPQVRQLRLDRRRGVSGPSLKLPRSEEHTSDLQSREILVCRRLLEKTKSF